MNQDGITLLSQGYHKGNSLSLDHIIYRVMLNQY